MWPDKIRHLTVASLLVLAFPILLLSVPKGASVFLAATSNCAFTLGLDSDCAHAC
jgi:hypothetical protein